MKVTKALAIGGASATGVGATAFGTKEIISVIQEKAKRKKMFQQWDENADSVERKFKF